MTDHVSSEKRSLIMAAIHNKDTGPEHVIRRLLYAAGYRYRLHVKNLPGKPDIVLRKYNAIIFVHGCFWHGHGCKFSKGLPKTRKDYWEAKILANKRRDEKAIDELLSNGWRVCTIWQCAINRKYKLKDPEVIDKIETWLRSKNKFIEIGCTTKDI